MHSEHIRTWYAIAYAKYFGYCTGFFYLGILSWGGGGNGSHQLQKIDVKFPPKASTVYMSKMAGQV